MTLPFTRWGKKLFCNDMTHFTNIGAGPGDTNRGTFLRNYQNLIRSLIIKISNGLLCQRSSWVPPYCNALESALSLCEFLLYNLSGFGAYCANQTKWFSSWIFISHFHLNFFVYAHREAFLHHGDVWSLHEAASKFVGKIQYFIKCCCWKSGCFMSHYHHHCPQE